MTKKLIPQEVTKIVIRGFEDEFELDDILMFKDMRNKIVIKSRDLLEGIYEGCSYSIIKHQKMMDYNSIIKDYIQASPRMKLTKIENDYISGQNSVIAYVFENKEMRDTDIKLNDLKLKKDDLTTLLGLTMEMLKNTER